MERTLRDREILKGIRDLSSKRATGKLQITTGTTQGAIFFDKGQIVDANLGKLNGFQAINAIASIPDGTFDFDPSISPPVQHLNFSERWVLTEVFGLKVQSEPKYSPTEPSDDAPTPPIPLNDIEEQPSSGVAEVEIEQVHELSSTDPAAVPTDPAPLNIQEQPPSTYYSKDDDIIPDNAPSKWSALKAFFRRKVQREPEYLVSVNEPSDDASTPAIFLNDVEEQPNTRVVQVEIEQLHELSSTDPAAVPIDTAPLNTQEQPTSTYYSNDDDIIPDNAPSKWSVLKALFGRKVQREPEYSAALNEPFDEAPAPAIPLNDIGEQPSIGVVQVEIEPVHELSSLDPAAAVMSDTTLLNTEEQPPSTYYSNVEDIIPDNAPSKWSVLKAFFRRNVRREPEYLLHVNEPSADAPTPAILLKDVEDQPNRSVVQVETEPVHELSSLDPAAMTLIATRFNTDEQLLTTHYSNHEDSIPDDADEVEVITGIAHLNDYRPVIFYEPSAQLRLRPTFVAAVLGILLGVITAALFYRSRELSLQHRPVVQTSSSANAPATQTPGFSSEVVSAAPDLTGKRVKVSENRQSFTRARKAPIEVKRSILHTKRPLIFRAAPRQEQVASTISPSSPSSPPRPSIARQSATPWREPAFRPAVAPAADPQPRSDANVLKRGANESIRGVRFVSSRVGSWVGSVFGKKKRSAQ